MHRPRFEIAIFGKGGYFYRAYNGRQTKATAGREGGKNVIPLPRGRDAVVVPSGRLVTSERPHLVLHTLTPKVDMASKEKGKRRFVECEGGS